MNMPRPADIESGRLANAIRRAFRDLKRIEGFDGARATVAEIINSEADRLSPTTRKDAA